MYYQDRAKLKSKNVRKFTSQSDCHDYLSNKVFTQENFIRHVTDTAKANNISYIVAFTIITNYLTNTLYEIDKQVVARRKKSKIRIIGFFSILTGFNLNATNKRINIINTLKRKQ